MKTEKIANRLVELCRKGENMKAYDELFSDSAIAIEPEGMPDNIAAGLDNLRAKTREWYNDVEEMHSMKVSDPVVGDNFFSCSMSMDLTSKSRGRMQMEEICVYEVKDDKIIKEQFFFSIPQEQPQEA
ncbi:MAG: SnoaL-like domain-containing protein [Owenweeksia sp.]